MNRLFAIVLLLFATVAQAKECIFKECFPASALITVTGLARPGLLVEVQGIAVVGSK